MCSNGSPPPPKNSLIVGLPGDNSITSFLPGFEHYRLHHQLYHYAMAERIRLAQQLQSQHTQHSSQQVASVGQANSSQIGVGSNFPTSLPLYTTGAGYPRSLALSTALLHLHHQQIPEEPKPQHSYIGLIAMAILSSPEKKLVLSDIYQHILEHYPYFRRRGPGWRNSIRHNLSLNDCFVKSGRSANGKGHYWAIHPANLEDFRRGDFRRRKAQRKVRRHMGLAVDEEPDSPSPPPLPSTPPPASFLGPSIIRQPIPELWNLQHQQQNIHQPHQTFTTHTFRNASFQPLRKRPFDVASLLAPDNEYTETTLQSTKARIFSCSEDEQEQDQDEEDVEVEVDVVAESSRSASPNHKSVDSHCNWRNASVLDQEIHHFPSLHVRNHLQYRSYTSTNKNTSSII